MPTFCACLVCRVVHAFGVSHFFRFTGLPIAFVLFARFCWCCWCCKTYLLHTFFIFVSLCGRQKPTIHSETNWIGKKTDPFQWPLKKINQYEESHSTQQCATRCACVCLPPIYFYTIFISYSLCRLQTAEAGAFSSRYLCLFFSLDYAFLLKFCLLWIVKRVNIDGKHSIYAEFMDARHIVSAKMFEVNFF